MKDICIYLHIYYSVIDWAQPRLRTTNACAQPSLRSVDRSRALDGAHEDEHGFAKAFKEGFARGFATGFVKVLRKAVHKHT